MSRKEIRRICTYQFTIISYEQVALDRVDPVALRRPFLKKK